MARGQVVEIGQYLTIGCIPIYHVNAGNYTHIEENVVAIVLTQITLFTKVMVSLLIRLAMLQNMKLMKERYLASAQVCVIYDTHDIDDTCDIWDAEQ